MMSLPGTGGSVTPGTQLRAARIAAGLSVADVAAQMRISVRQVEALEADRYAELPGTVFVRGFIRNYARVLKLDAVPLLHALEPVLAQEAPLKAQPTSGRLPVSTRRDHSKLLLALFAALFILVVAAGAYELWNRQHDQAGPSSSAPVRDVVPQQARKPQAGGSDVLVGAPAQPSAQQEAHSPISHGSDSAIPVAPVDPAPAPQTAGPAVSARSRIGLQFALDTWVEIRDREGRVLMSGTGLAASERHLEGAPPFAVVIGNVKGVRITYNERPFDLAAYSARNTARFTLE